ncbi:MAG: metallophosphoesterase [Deltaproteobacteria bacterium]|jgi:predicted MPP superfamily phosphohydrolase|nr:metallophosphoesterase [Deltaproteobacteria bacterium]
MFVAVALVLVLACFVLPHLFKKMVGRPKRAWPFQIVNAVLSFGFLALIPSQAYVEPNVFLAGFYDIMGLYIMFQLYFLVYMVVLALIVFGAKKASKGPEGKGPKAFGKWAAVAGLVVFAGLVVYGAVSARFFAVTEYEIALPGLEKPVTLVHAPDLHLGNARGKAYLESVLEAIIAQKPDIVFYNGDLVDGKLALRDEVFELFKGVKAEQYFTTGNHEYYVGANLVIDWVKKAGIKVLRSELVITHGFQLIGLEYMNADRESSDPHQVNQLALNEELPKIRRRTDLPLVVVHHSPVGVDYVRQGGAAAMLSGHTHGGQVFPGNLIIASRFPMYKGRYQVGPMTLVVSQGLGTFGPMMRLGSQNELQVIRFLPAPSPAGTPGKDPLADPAPDPDPVPDSGPERASEPDPDAEATLAPIDG